MKAGDNVTDKETGEAGKVVRVLANGLVLVRLAGGAECHYSAWELEKGKGKAA